MFFMKRPDRATTDIEGGQLLNSSKVQTEEGQPLMYLLRVGNSPTESVVSEQLRLERINCSPMVICTLDCSKRVD